MVVTKRRIRAISTDRRVWGLTCLLVGWPAVGILAESNFVLESATPLVYVYLLLLRAVVGTVPGFHLFWVGFALFCSAIATVLVGAFDWLRMRWTASKRSNASR